MTLINTNPLDEVSEAATGEIFELTELTPEPADDDFADLDSLLSESLDAVNLQKVKKRGLQLSAEQQDRLDAIRGVGEALRWRNVRAYAHTVKIECACGNVVRTFCGWYVYQEQRSVKGVSGGRRLHRIAAKPADTPSFHYHTIEQHTACHRCIEAQGLPPASEAECDLLQLL